MNVILRSSLIVFSLLAASTSATAQLWLPNIQQRAIFSIITNPMNPRTLYAGGYGRALFASSDAGATWQELSVGDLGGISQITALAMHPKDTNVIFAGGVNFSGVDRSTDGGITWQNVLNDPEGRRFEIYSKGSIDFNPRNPDTVYVLRSYPAAVYRSPNKGVRWDSIGTIPGLVTSDRMNSLAVCPQPDSAHIMLASGRRSVMFRSTDAGRNWASTGTMMAGHPDCDVVQIRWSPSIPGRVYAVGQYQIKTNATNAGLMISNDYGLTWETRKFQDTSLMSLEVFPTKNGDEIFIGGGQWFLSDKSIKGDSIVLRSVDGGTTWQDLSKVEWMTNELGDVGSNIWGFAVTRDDNGLYEVVMATEGGTYRSTAVTSVQPTSTSGTASITSTPTMLIIRTADGQAATYVVTNLLGATVATGSIPAGSSEERIRITDLPHGTYAVRVIHPTGVSTALVLR
ncbi:MAG: hypothetical protein FGM33_07120 [Candidatus Kapabacteria bacterium]|nr:hypothetical protein [Candidatus Kapabacteria bacterium]